MCRISASYALDMGVCKNIMGIFLLRIPFLKKNTFYRGLCGIFRTFSGVFCWQIITRQLLFQSMHGKFSAVHNCYICLIFV